MEYRPVTVVVDDQDVPLQCAALTVGELCDVAKFGWPRGKSSDQALLPRVRAIDQYVTALLEVDGQVCQCPPARLFVSRPFVVSQLYDALLGVQRVSPQERESLEIAFRFTHFLGSLEGVASKWAMTGTDCGKCHELGLCDQRGCGGTPSKSVVWHDKQVILHTCPVLHFTSDVERVLNLFFHTHIFNGSTMEFKFLPAEGGMLDQDAWLMDAFAVLRRVHHEVVREAMANA